MRSRTPARARERGGVLGDTLSANPVRRHALGAAWRATAIAAAVFVAACALLDAAFEVHLQDNVRARLAEQLTDLVRHEAGHLTGVPGAAGGNPANATGGNPANAAGGNPAGAASSPAGDDTEAQEDYDQVPIVSWWVPTGAGRATPLSPGTPDLPPSLFTTAGPMDATIGTHIFTVMGTSVTGGRFVVATSPAEVGHFVGTLALAEVLLAPAVLGSFFAVAYVIGRRAAAPVDAARRRQLDFSADASHELRTPLSVIEAETEIALARERGPDEYRAALERISGESARLRSIVDDLLWLARFDGRAPERTGERVDLGVLADSCADRFSALAARRALSFSVEHDPGGSVIVEAPPEWLDRLVTVLVDNACRYTPADGSIVVRARMNDTRSELSVEDSGPGIPDEERRRVFTRFHRASAAPGGAGLGLAIADAVVRATGGAWDIGTSSLGGARMTVTWPRTVRTA